MNIIKLHSDILMKSIAGLVIAGSIVGYGEYRRYSLARDVNQIEQKLIIEKIEKEGLEKRISDMEAELLSIEKEGLAMTDELRAQLEKEQSKRTEFQEEIGKTVGTLDKLAKTDPELLQKYSKVYFLNEHYVPVELDEINQDYLFEKNKTLEIHASVAPYLEKLLKDATEDGVILQVVSAFRSFGTQSVLKSSYRITYGAGTANQFSAEQGYSEHQLGTAVDFATPETGATLAGFDRTPEYAWLTENAYKYGFSLSYPKDNAYYQYEPWHWRFVGVALARRLHSESKYFYDLDQREINEYLAEIFD